MEWIYNEWWMLGFAVLGMIAHILKKNVKGESLIDIKNYFTYNPKTTFLSIIATFAGYVIYMTSFQTNTVVDFGVLFGIGYMCESAFNKYEAAEKKVE